MLKLTIRQQKILDFIGLKGKTSNRFIFDFLEKEGTEVTRMTITRDLRVLEEGGFIQSSGKGRSLAYEIVSGHPLLRPLDSEAYFKIPSDKRSIRFERFNFDIFNHFENIITAKELLVFISANNLYHKHLTTMPADVLTREFERLTIEFSWKSSHIEGNTYTLLDTERLLKDQQEAPGHSHAEATMILNHKKALDYIRSDLGRYKVLTMATIQDIHRLLVDGLGIEHGFRSRPVGIIGTRYQPLDNKYQIEEAIQKLLVVLNGKYASDPYSRALVALLMLSYLQPFEDGNKRTARLVSNAILLAGGTAPLSYRSVDEVEYKKALILFYEQNNVLLFKKLFLEQFEFAVK